MTNSAPMARPNPGCWGSIGRGEAWFSAESTRARVSGNWRPPVSWPKPIAAPVLIFPETVVVSEFDEYPAEAVLRECLPQLLQSNAEIKELRRAYQKSSEVAGSPHSLDRRTTFQRLFETVIGKWVAGEVTADGIESWHEFCSRVERGLARIVRDTPPAASAAVFTSAGPIGAAMRRALHLSAEDTLQLTWISRNASFNSFLASGERFTLSTFQCAPASRRGRVADVSIADTGIANMVAFAIKQEW